MQDTGRVRAGQAAASPVELHCRARGSNRSSIGILHDKTLLPHHFHELPSGLRRRVEGSSGSTPGTAKGPTSSGMARGGGGKSAAAKHAGKVCVQVDPSWGRKCHKASIHHPSAEPVKFRALTLCNRCSHRCLGGPIFHWVIGFKAQSWQGHALARKIIILRRSGPASISPRCSRCTCSASFIRHSKQVEPPHLVPLAPLRRMIAAPSEYRMIAPASNPSTPVTPFCKVLDIVVSSQLHPHGHLHVHTVLARAFPLQLSSLKAGSS